MYHLDKKEIRDITNYIFLENALAPADVIFIPGCARPEHTEEAARLYREGYATLLIPSGRYAKAAGCFQGVAKGAERYGTDFACEADFLAEVLRQNGVPDEAVLPEREATYTWKMPKRPGNCSSGSGEDCLGGPSSAARPTTPAGRIFTTRWSSRRWRFSSIPQLSTALPGRAGTAPPPAAGRFSANCPGWVNKYS